MSTYLQLVNKVLEESGSEMDSLTAGNWDSAEAGRRLYPRVKRYVAEAWKMIQMDRNEWEFKAKELTAVVYSAMKFKFGDRAAGSPAAGTVFVGASSGFSFEVRSVELRNGAFADGDAEGLIYFENSTGSPTIGETFVEESPGVGEFVYLEQGSYDFSSEDDLYREMHWETMTAYSDNSSPIPVQFIPWDNWPYQESEYANGMVPTHFSQDFEGRIVFYPQPYTPFSVNFVYDTGPQELTDFGDSPVGLAAEYHDWIAWKALGMLARYDKNPDLFSHSAAMEVFYRNRAERNSLPIVSWGANKFYE